MSGERELIERIDLALKYVLDNEREVSVSAFNRVLRSQIYPLVCVVGNSQDLLDEYHNWLVAIDFCDSCGVREYNVAAKLLGFS